MFWSISYLRENNIPGNYTVELEVDYLSPQLFFYLTQVLVSNLKFLVNFI